MIYTKDKPPVIKANLGDLSAAPTCYVVNAGGVAVCDGVMYDIPNTALWYFAVPSLSLSPTGGEYAYYISDVNGNTLEEGTFTLADNSINLVGAIASKDIDCPSVIGTPMSVSGTKTYSIRFRPAAADGTFLSGVTEINGQLGPRISLNFKNPINASTHDIDAHMSLDGSSWVYDWSVTYSTPEDIVKVVISCEHADKQYTFTRNVEILKPREFNPQRLSVGMVG